MTTSTAPGEDGLGEGGPLVLAGLFLWPSPREGERGAVINLDHAGP